MHRGSRSRDPASGSDISTFVLGRRQTLARGADVVGLSERRQGADRWSHHAGVPAPLFDTALLEGVSERNLREIPEERVSAVRVSGLAGLNRVDGERTILHRLPDLATGHGDPTPLELATKLTTSWCDTVVALIQQPLSVQPSFARRLLRALVATEQIL